MARPIVLPGSCETDCVRGAQRGALRGITSIHWSQPQFDEGTINVIAYKTYYSISHIYENGETMLHTGTAELELEHACMARQSDALAIAPHVDCT